MSFYEDYLNKKQESEEKESEEQIIKAPEEGPIEELVSSSREKEQADREKFLRKIYGSSKEESIPEKDLVNKIENDIPTPISPALTKGQKIWIRIVVGFLILVILAFLTGVFWRWTIQNPRVIIKEDVHETEKLVTIPEILAPKSIFKYDRLFESTITQNSELITYIKQYIEKKYSKGELIKISFKDQKNKLNPQFIALPDLFSILEMRSSPKAFDLAIKEDLNVFIYSGEKNDIGFAFPVNPDNLVEFQGIILGTWDNTIERDVAPLFSLVQKNEKLSPAAVTYKGANIRCKGEEVTSFCYTIFKNHFIATSSLESIEVAINNFITN